MNKNGFINIIIIGVVVVIIATAGYLAMTRKTVEAPATVQETEVKDLPAEVLTKEGWKTYRNEEYGFEVKYPNEFVKLNKDAVPQSGGLHSVAFLAIKQKIVDDKKFPAFSIDIEILNNNQSEEDYFSKQIKYLTNSNNEVGENWKIINFAGLKWIMIWGFPGLYSTTQFTTPRGDYLYQFSLMTPEIIKKGGFTQDPDIVEALNITEQILSTFKFIE